MSLQGVHNTEPRYLNTRVRTLTEKMCAGVEKREPRERKKVRCGGEAAQKLSLRPNILVSEFWETQNCSSVRETHGQQGPLRRCYDEPALQTRKLRLSYSPKSHSLSVKQPGFEHSWSHEPGPLSSKLCFLFLSLAQSKDPTDQCMKEWGGGNLA